MKHFDQIKQSYKRFDFFVSLLIVSLPFLSPLQGMELVTPIQAHSPLQVLVQNVGQGNCIIVKMIQEGQDKVSDPMYDVLLVDCGTSSYQMPRGQASATPIKEDQDIPPLVSTPRQKEFTSHAGSQSIEKKLRKKKPDSDPLKVLKNAAIKEIMGKHENTDHIKAVMITHPDKDHFSLIQPICEKLKTTPPFIVGGAPEKYLTTSDPISKFLKEHINKVYFTAVRGGIINDMDEDYQIQDSHYMVSLTSTDKDDSPFSTLKLNPRFEVKLLSVNANHVVNLNSEPRQVTNISSTEDGLDDYNTDSLIVKITDKATGKSTILTGDATGTTTTRLMDRVTHDPDLALELQADVLVASHHGASSHGSNNESWIRTVNPEFIIISTGGSYGHPTRKAYQAFHTSPRLAKVTPHDVIVGGLARSVVTHRITFSGIFSTLPHGNIQVDFPAEKDEPIKIISEKTQKADKTFISEGIWNAPPTNYMENKERKIETESLAKIEEPVSYQALINLYLAKEHSFQPLSLSLDESENSFIREYLKMRSTEKEIEKIEALLTVTPQLEGIIQFSPSSLLIPPLKIDLTDPRNLHLLRQLEPEQALDEKEDLLTSPLPPPLVSSSSAEIYTLESFIDFMRYLLDEKIVKTQGDLAKKVLPSYHKSTAASYLSRILNRKEIQGLSAEKKADLVSEILENLLNNYSQEYQKFINTRSQQ